MATNIDLNLDSKGSGLLSGGSARTSRIPVLYRNDVYDFRVRVLDQDNTGIRSDATLSSPSFKLGIGGLDAIPTDGEFKLTLAGPVTSSAIPYNATTTQVFNAISGIAGNATVTTFGSEDSAWIITAATSNTALSFGGVSFTLFPVSSVLVNTRRDPGADIKAQQVIQLKRSPAVYADSFSAAPTAGVISLTKTQDGDSSTNKNETYQLKVGSDAIGGGFILNYGTNSTTAIPVYANAVSMADALGAVTGIGYGNISVDSGENTKEYSISFVRALGNTNITTALTLDASGVIFAKFYKATVTMGTSGIDQLFSEEGTDTVTPTLEIEISQSGNTQTLLQSTITVSRDLITSGAAVPSPQASYYTKAEVDAGFVPNSSGNVDSTSRILNDSSSFDSINWQSRKLYNTSGSEVLRYDGGLGFFGVTATAQPTGSNVISNLVQLGLTPNTSSTQGIFPLSSKTLTTTASLWFNGNVAANDIHSVSIGLTGANPNDIVLIGLPSSVCAGLTFQGCVPAANVVCITAQNGTNSAQNQSTATYRITVIGY